MSPNRSTLSIEALNAISLIFRSIAAKRTLPYHGYDISRAQGCALFIISHTEGISVKELAAKLQVTSGAVTQFVDVLVEKGLVERTEDSIDRRIQRVQLTNTTKKTFEEFHTQYLQQAVPIFNVLTDLELTQLTSLLAKINK